MTSTKSFRLSVVTDEISQDFGHACEVASRQFGMGYVELRSLWDKNVVALNAEEITEALRTLQKNNLGVSAIASPLFKVDWPSAPESKFGPARDQFNAAFPFDQQNEVLERGISLAHAFGTTLVRCFDFWRLDDRNPYRDAIHRVLLEAAEKAGRNGITLVLENEFACNTATAAEAARTLAAVPSQFFMLNWDPGNAAMAGETPYPDGYRLLPKERIRHCHCKDVSRTNGRNDWAAVGQGCIDWVGQFQALQRDGYQGLIALETHWRGAGTPEASTATSWAGMKEALQKAGAP
jgi:L-ribulose-5-phosphate 3-epimerase